VRLGLLRVMTTLSKDEGDALDNHSEPEAQVTLDDGYIERELKLTADPTLEIPDLRRVAGGAVWLSEQQLSTAYFDTPELRLWHRGITLRHRTGEASVVGTWTVKLPIGDEGPTLNRTELSWSGSREEFPAAAVRLLEGIVRRSNLNLVAQLATTRRRLALVDTKGVSHGELDDDTVAVIRGRQAGLHFRQIELELGAGGEALVKPVLKMLKRAGAVPANEPKLGKALGLSTESSARPRVKIRRNCSLGELVNALVADSVDQLLNHDYRMRIDPSDPPAHDVHQARVATRRLRSDLKTLHPMLDPRWVDQTRAELKWLGAVLGRIRDADVLAGRLGLSGEGSSIDADGQIELCSVLAEQRQAHCRELANALTSERYFTLIDRLVAGAESVPLEEGTRPQHGLGRTPLVDHPAKKVVPALVLKRWQSLRREVRKAGRHPTDQELHRMRIRAKELRYAAETAAPVIGKPARRTAHAAEVIQTVLGEHHDAVSAELWLRTQAMKGTLEASYAAGLLAAEQAQAQRKLRRRWRSAWRGLDQSKLRSWF
jgi:CHAD domain-containing protein